MCLGRVVWRGVCCGGGGLGETTHNARRGGAPAAAKRRGQGAVSRADQRAAHHPAVRSRQGRPPAHACALPCPHRRPRPPPFFSGADAAAVAAPARSPGVDRHRCMHHHSFIQTHAVVPRTNLRPRHVLDGVDPRARERHGCPCLLGGGGGDEDENTQAKAMMGWCCWVNSTSHHHHTTTSNRLSYVRTRGPTRGPTPISNRNRWISIEGKGGRIGRRRRRSDARGRASTRLGVRERPSWLNDEVDPPPLTPAAVKTISRIQQPDERVCVAFARVHAHFLPLRRLIDQCIAWD